MPLVGVELVHKKGGVKLLLLYYEEKQETSSILPPTFNRHNPLTPIYDEEFILLVKLKKNMLLKIQYFLEMKKAYNLLFSGNSCKFLAFFIRPFG